MVWWQIVLILLGSIVIGVIGGFFLYHLIIVRLVGLVRRRFIVNQYPRWRFPSKRKAASVAEQPGHELSSMVNEQEERKHEVQSMAMGKEDKEVARMVPLFSRRSIVFLIIGFIVGSCLGIGYWAISPIKVGFSEEWPPIRVTGLTEPRPTVYESRVTIGVTGWWERPSEREKLESFGEVCGMTLNSLVFMEHLSQKLVEAGSQYQRSPEELQRMVKASYRYGEHHIRVLVTSYDPEESAAVADLIAGVFIPYMDERVDVMFDDRYQSIVKKMDLISADLVQAEKELVALAPPSDGTAEDPTLDPDYLVLQAQEAVLSDRLRELVSTLVLLDDDDAVDRHKYFNITHEMDEVSQELAETRVKMDAFDLQSDDEGLKMTPAYLTITAKQYALDRQRKTLINSLIALTSQYLEEVDLLGSLKIGSASAAASLPPDRIRGRYAVILGSLVGLGGAWLVLNFRALVHQIRLSPLISSAELGEEEEEEE
jgi:hypothetical protein